MAGTYDDILSGGTYGDILSGKPQKNPINKRIPTATEAASRGALKGLVSALQGPAFGFADEALAALAAPGKSLVTGKSLADSYREQRDTYRGLTEEARKQNPMMSAGTSMMASAPTMLIPGINVSAANPLVARILSGAATGGAFGAVSGAGESTAEDFGGIVVDTAKGAGMSAAVGGSAPVIGATARAVGRQVTGRVGTAAAKRNYAMEKVAQELARDAGGNGTVSEGVRRAEAQLRGLGPDAVIADTGKRNVKALTDVLATLPGSTGNRLDRLKLERQATRGNRLANQADIALGAKGKDFADEMARMAQERTNAAGPLYDALRGVNITVSDDLANLLKRTKPAHASAAELAKWEGRALDLGSVKKGDSISFDDLDQLKQALFDKATSLRRAGENQQALKADEARIALTNLLDDVSPKDSAGNSIYKAARDAWGGHTSVMSAADIGASAFTMKPHEFQMATRGMGSAEREALKIGMAQSIREMTGTQAGQTKLLKMWMEPATGNRIKAVFGGDAQNFKKFVKALAVEEKKKGLERLGVGSQTAQRSEKAVDLDQSAVDAAEAVVTSGGMRNFLAEKIRGLKGVQTPEPVRNEMGKILLGDGKSLRQIAEYQKAVDAARLRNAQLAGKFIGVQ